MSFTVTATATNGFDDVLLKVYVVTNGTEAGGASSVSGGFTSPTFSLTPNASGSLIVEGVYTADPGAAAVTPNASNSTDDSGATSGNAPWWFGHWTGAVTGGSAITTLGGTNVTNWQSWAAFEAEATGGSPAIDASTPAAVDGSTSAATTAGFTPPAASVLVAVVLASGTATQVFTMSDTSGLGLTWTQRGSTYSSAFVGSSAVFTTTMPGGGPPVVNIPPFLAPMRLT